MRFGGLTQAGGGTPAGAAAAATRLIQQGATALVSFGLAGGLDPLLRPGTMIIATDVLSDGQRLPVDPALAARFGGPTLHTILAGTTIVSDAATKRALFTRTGAQAVDLESGAVARIAQSYGLPFAVVRAVCDPANRRLPPAALVAMNPDGQIDLMSIMQALRQQPSQVGALLALAYDAAQARRTLIRMAKRFRKP